jgi:hypothetical protein
LLVEQEVMQVLLGRQAMAALEELGGLGVNLTFKVVQVRVVQAGMVGAVEGEALYQHHNVTVVFLGFLVFHRQLY